MYLFLENPDKSDVTIFTILMVTKPFATVKMQQWCYMLIYHDSVELCFSSADNVVIIDDPMAMTAVCR
jgi:hypothetical protein